MGWRNCCMVFGAIWSTVTSVVLLYVSLAHLTDLSVNVGVNVIALSVTTLSVLWIASSVALIVYVFGGRRDGRRELLLPWLVINSIFMVGYVIGLCACSTFVVLTLIPWNRAGRTFSNVTICVFAFGAAVFGFFTVFSVSSEVAICQTYRGATSTDSEAHSSSDDSGDGGYGWERKVWKKQRKRRWK